VLGRVVTSLHSGTVTPGTPESFECETESLVSGPYFVRVRGETFNNQRKFFVVR
jgi:hypothetical protein